MGTAINGTPFTSMPQVEDYQTVNVTVQVRLFGKPDQVRREVLEAMGLALHNTFGSDRVKLFLGGHRVVYDPLAHDGEHEGHDVILAITDEKPV